MVFILVGVALPVKVRVLFLDLNRATYLISTSHSDSDRMSEAAYAPNYLASCFLFLLFHVCVFTFISEIKTADTRMRDNAIG